MSEKPKKRLVSKGRYAWMTAKRTILLSASVACFLFGAYWLFCVIFLLLLSRKPLDFLEIVLALIIVMISGVGFLLGIYFFKKERKVERVVPITNRTATTLPPEESLVRASALPPSHQQAELLRAAQYGKETPAEELLRATANRQGD